MAYTRTYSATNTYVRKEALKLQFHIALMRSMDPASLSQLGLDGILKGVGNEWIDNLTIYGLDQAGRARAALVLQIDWSRYLVHMNAGRTHVVIDERWPAETAIELTAAMRLFSEFCRNNRLRTQRRVGYRAGLDAAAIDRPRLPPRAPHPLGRYPGGRHGQPDPRARRDARPAPNGRLGGVVGRGPIQPCGSIGS